MYRNDKWKFNIFTAPTFEGIYDGVDQVVGQGSDGYAALSGMFPEFDLVAQQHLMDTVIEHGRQFHFGRILKQQTNTNDVSVVRSADDEYMVVRHEHSRIF